jgi:pimeloyl-ACP methyl ester carboxylesterase
MNPKVIGIKGIFKGIIIVLGVFAVLVYIGLPAGMAVYTVLPGKADVGEAPEGFSELTLQTEDGVSLRAWYRAPSNGAAIILIHGAGNSRESLRGYAKLLAGHGYGVLALDLRGHGESEGKTNRVGWQGSRDVGAAVAFLEGQEDVQAIGGLGISLGGEALLGAASQYPAIRAIAADGASQRCTAELLALESERPLVRSFTARVMYAAVQLFSGEKPPKPLLGSMVESGSTQFLLISAGQNGLETAFNQTFAQTLGSRATLWVAPEADHTAAFYVYPEEYEQKVMAFFETGLK